jgi:hypothetical protein
MISKINGNYIFFPKAGIKEDNGMSLNKIDSGVWTSNTSLSSCA